MFSLARSVLLVPLAALAFGCSEVSAVQDRTEAERQVRQANADYDRAIVTADAAALDSIMSDDFVHVTAEGEVRDKTTQIATITSGRLQVMSAGSEDVGLRWIGDDALLVGRFPARVRMGERTITINERYSTLWSRMDGRWRLRHEHSSLIPPGR
jgi:uncharacterized protein (TIGR02246 family)